MPFLEKIMRIIFARSALLVMALVAQTAYAQKAEVIHWWTSQGEAAAAKVLADAYRKAGGTWVDTAIANPIEGRSVTVYRINGGKPPTVAQFNPSQQYREFIGEGLLNTIDEVALLQGWDKVLPEQTKQAVKSDGKYYAVPLGIHNSGWFWYSKEVFAKAGVKAEPQNIEEFFVALEQIKKAGITPLALGGQSWQENILFITLLHTSGGAELYRRFFSSTDGKVAESPEFKKVLTNFKRLKAYVDAGSPNREWNLATNMLINNKAGFQVMGDWVKAEFAGAKKIAGKDYGCFPGFGPNAPYLLEGDVFVFPKSRDPQAAKAQALFASVVMSPEIQLAFNAKKGSIPVRTDLTFGVTDICTQQGVAAMKNPARRLVGPDQLASPTRAGQIQEDITKFWNSNQSVDDAAKALAKTLRQQ
jgi:glucose/mannose transport system substrate-binding protein